MHTVEQGVGVMTSRQTRRQDYGTQLNKEIGLANLSRSSICREAEFRP